LAADLNELAWSEDAGLQGEEMVFRIVDLGNRFKKLKRRATLDIAVTRLHLVINQVKRTACDLYN